MASDQSKNDSQNRCAFVSLRNCSSELAACGWWQTVSGSSGRHRKRPVAEGRTSFDGTSSVVVFVERRRRRAGTSAVSWRHYRQGRLFPNNQGPIFPNFPRFPSLPHSPFPLPSLFSLPLVLPSLPFIPLLPRNGLLETS